MTSDAGVDPAWLALREPADAAARSAELVDRVRDMMVADRRLLIHDLGSGTGSMARWLGPRLTGPQHWVLHDRNGDLLARAAADPPSAAADGSPVTVETCEDDITRLTAADLAGAALITASALFDMLTVEEVQKLAAVCLSANCPVLLTITVVGDVHLDPPDSLDSAFAAAFDAHQRRTTARGRLLGPDAIPVAVEAFSRLGADVTVRSSPWQLTGVEQAALTAQWLAGWVEAACEQSAQLTGPAVSYLRRRTAELTAGRLRVTVSHDDVLSVPR